MKTPPPYIINQETVTEFQLLPSLILMNWFINNTWHPALPSPSPLSHVPSVTIRDDKMNESLQVEINQIGYETWQHALHGRTQSKIAGGGGGSPRFRRAPCCWWWFGIRKRAPARKKGTFVHDYRGAAAPLPPARYGPALSVLYPHLSLWVCVHIAFKRGGQIKLTNSLTIRCFP